MTVHEWKARQAKAAKLVAVLVAHGSTAAQAAALPESGRRMVEAIAGTRPASDDTWQLVVRDMSDAEDVAARRAALWVANEAVMV